jgi:hypothetical protein
MASGLLMTVVTGVSSTPNLLAAKVNASLGSNKRGVIVYVYAVNGNDDELEAYENGNFGNYYNALE